MLFISEEEPLNPERKGVTRKAAVGCGRSGGGGAR